MMMNRCRILQDLIHKMDLMMEDYDTAAKQYHESVANGFPCACVKIEMQGDYRREAYEFLYVDIVNKLHDDIAKGLDTPHHYVESPWPTIGLVGNHRIEMAQYVRSVLIKMRQDTLDKRLRKKGKRHAGSQSR